MNENIEYDYSKKMKNNSKSYLESNISIEQVFPDKTTADISIETKSSEVDFGSVGKPKRIVRKYKLIHD